MADAVVTDVPKNGSEAAGDAKPRGADGKFQKAEPTYKESGVQDERLARIYEKVDQEDQGPTLGDLLGRIEDRGDGEGAEPATEETQEDEPVVTQKPRQQKQEPKAEPESKAEPAKPDPLSELSVKLEKMQTSMQARIDELTAKNKALEEKTTKPAEPEQPKQRGLTDLSEPELDQFLEQAEENAFFDGDEKKNRRVVRDILKEQASRAVRKELEPIRKSSQQDAEAAQLVQAHTESMGRVAEKYGRYIYSKDEKGSLVLDPKLPVAKRAAEVFAELVKDPALARHPNLPYLAASQAYAEVTAGADAETLRKMHRLETENERLKNGTRMDGGQPGGGEKAKPKEQKPEDYIRSLRAQSSRGRGSA